MYSNSEHFTSKCSIFFYFMFAVELLVGIISSNFCKVPKILGFMLRRKIYFCDFIIDSVRSQYLNLLDLQLFSIIFISTKLFSFLLFYWIQLYNRSKIKFVIDLQKTCKFFETRDKIFLGEEHVFKLYFFPQVFTWSFATRSQQVNIL